MNAINTNHERTSQQFNMEEMETIRLALVDVLCASNKDFTKYWNLILKISCMQRDAKEEIKDRWMSKEFLDQFE